MVGCEGLSAERVEEGGATKILNMRWLKIALPWLALGEVAGYEGDHDSRIPRSNKSTSSRHSTIEASTYLDSTLSTLSPASGLPSSPTLASRPPPSPRLDHDYVRPDPKLIILRARPEQLLRSGVRQMGL